MNSLATTAYTPLESLLLFQALRAEPNISFTRIAEDLNSVPLVRNDPSYDLARLTPTALRQLYLDLLKDEAKRDLERQLNATCLPTNGDDLSPTSRKRKAPSPKLPTVQDAAKHSHLIPQLIDRLYVRYREITVKQIREQEARHDVAAQEVEEIKSGKWDQNLQQAHSGSMQTSPKMAVSSLIQQPDEQGTKSATPSAGVRSLSQVRIDAVINHGPTPTPPPPANDQAGHRRTASGTILPPLSELASYVPPKVPASGYAYQPSPPAVQQPNFPPPHAHHTASPQMMSRTSSSPRPILPPPSGLAAPVSPGLSTPTSVHSPQTYNNQRIQSGLPQQQAANYQRAYQSNQAPHLPAQNAYYQQQQQQQSHQDQRSSYSTPHSTPQQQQYQMQGSHTQFMPPQYQVAYQDPGRQQQAQYPNVYSQPAIQQPYIRNAPATGPRQQPAQRVIMSDVLRALTTPPRSLRQPVWKSENRPPPGGMPGSPKRPVAEPLSPLLARAPSPVHTSKRSGQFGRNTEKLKREGSIAFSDAEDSTSASVASLTEDAHSTRRRVKNGQSIPFVADSEEPEASIMVTRRRRGTLTSAQLAQVKRKRQDSTDNTSEHDQPQPRPTTILATKNFAKMSSVIMNEVIGHKHGSRFAQPVRDRDADGYSTFIKRPQDLKSIRAAITQGSRAIANTTAEPTSAPSENVVEVERSIDLMPPKAIVNGAQLERELMRMFANAVMFNPGEDGMVADTREMFEDVEAKIAEWRSAERDVAAGVAAEDEDDGSRAKRRKL